MDRAPAHPEICVDCRETALITALRACDVNITVRQLPHGDVLLSDRTVIERKTRADYEASIIDNRLFIQARNLTEMFSRVILIVEGEAFAERVQRAALLGALSSLILDFGISVLFTRNVRKTAELIEALARREQLEHRHPLRLVGCKRATSVQEYQQCILQSFPLIGPTFADKLLSEFGSLSTIFSTPEKDIARVVGRKRARLFRTVLTSSVSPPTQKTVKRDHSEEKMSAPSGT